MAHPLNFEDPSILRVLVGLAVALVIVQPRISRWIAKRREADGVEGTDHHSITPLLLIFTFLIGIYGGCFTAAQGVLMMAVMGVMLPEPLQRLNGTRNVLSALVNVVAGTVLLSSRRSTGLLSPCSLSARTSVGSSAPRSGSS
ncbi:TSUP family transporter [Streptomyces chiangmaiensis]